MAQRWRDDENREYGGNQRPRTWDQREQGGWQGEGGGWQGRGDEEYERWGRGAAGGGPGGEQQGGGIYGREGDEVRHGGNPERRYGEMAAEDRGSRDAPYSHGGYGHRQRQGMGGSSQTGYGAGGYGYERDWQREPAERGRQYGGRDYEQGGSRWGQFGGPGRGAPGEETWGPRAQRSLGHWRDRYGSGEEYGQGGGPAGQMDVGHGDYGRDMRGHRGKGPKGYERSAERLKEDICERLTEAPDVDASEISIAVKDGIVTLEGSVESRQMKHRAEDIAESCMGVKDVENRLKVQAQGERQASESAAGQSGVSNQNRLAGGGPLHH